MLRLNNMDTLTKIIMSLSVNLAKQDTTLTTEEEVASMATAIFEDAMLDVPLKIPGKAIREQALRILKDHSEGIESPYFPKPEFNMNELYGKTVNASLKQVFELMALHCEVLGRPLVAPTIESDKVCRETLDTLTLGIFNILNNNKVPLAWYGGLFEDIKSILLETDNLMKDQVKGHMKEIMSRTLGAKHPNPKKAKFNDEFATYADLLAARERVFKDTGGRQEDYFGDKDDTLLA